jgi:hypothetical protein
MDLFNVLPHRLRLRIKDSFPTSESLPYLNNIKHLESITVDLTFPVPGTPTQWKDLGTKPIRWLSTGRMPTPEELREFTTSAPGAGLRALTLDLDSPLSPSEINLLESLSIPVEWTHIPLAP